MMETENVIKELISTVDEVAKRSDTYPTDAHSRQCQLMKLVSDCALQLGLILQNIEKKLD